jgi:phosphatidate cytidylyltransferase
LSDVKAQGGRSVSKSLVVGLLLAAIFLASILVYKEFFILLLVTATAIGAWELSTALRIKGWYVPRVPAVVGSAIIMPATYYGGPVVQWLVSIGIVAALIVWRTVHLLWERRKANFQTFLRTIRDFGAAAFLVIYLPLSLSFSMLLLRRPDDGAYWVLTFVATVALIDSAGYLFGRVFGKHKLAPGVSPKKTWEGLLASIVLGSATAITLTMFLLQGPWWVGLILAAAIILAAVFGDLAESLIKRDLGVKDMSKLLPGHGGMMDRLDSMLPASLMTYLVMVVFFG